MVFFLTGVPGSGKTYYLVNFAEQNIDKLDKKTGAKVYKQVVHNISGYKNGLYVDFGSDYLPKIIELNKYYLSIKKQLDKDNLLIEKAEKLGIYKILLIVDECHLYFVNDYSEKGKEMYYALLWFISYHRHLYIDMVLATQNLSLVDYKFKGFAEYFVKAVPSSLRFSLNPFSTKFTYFYFPDSKMWIDTRYKVEKLPAEKRIFELYTSGDSVKKQKVFLSTLLLIGGFIIVGSVLWFMFQRSLVSGGHPVDSVIEDVKSPDSLKNEAPVSPPPRSHKQRSDTKIVDTDALFDVVTCSVDSGNCSSELTTNKIHYRLFSKMLKLKWIEAFHKKSQYGIITYYLVLHIPKNTYTSKFLIESPGTQRLHRKKNFDVDFNEIKHRFTEVTK